MSSLFMRRSMLVLPSLVSAAALACGGTSGTERKDTAAGKPGTTTSVAAGTVTTPTPTATTGNAATVSYADAESVYNSGRYGEAAELFGRYAGQRPENPWGHYMLGLSAWKSGDLVRAEQAFGEALVRDPAHVKSLLNSSRVLLELDRPEEALERIATALEIDPASSEALRLRGRALHESGDLDGAILAYRAALASDERDSWAMNNLGLVYLQQSRAEEALGPLARAVELRGNAPVFRNNLGIALERTGHTAAAREAFEAALAVDSTYGKAAVSLARVTAVTDTVSSDSVDLPALAATFKAQVRMWRDSIPVVADTAAVVDSIQPARAEEE
jgi:tetratricopeptide (TPR) repeat protein